MEPPNPPPERIELTPLRYFAYTSQLGEVFRYLIGGRMVAHAYTLAFAFVLADSINKSKQEYKRKKEHNLTRVLYVGVDNFVWQMFASVLIPGVILRTTCAFFYNRTYNLPKPVRGFSVASIGIMTIPIIVRPIDDFVDNVLDVTLRRFAP